MSFSAASSGTAEAGPEPDLERRRLELREPSTDDEDWSDSVIGLDVGGQIFYTHKSTLTAGSAYFAARFGGAFSAGESYEDERGRNVYFVDANGDLFVHILDYLRRGVPSWSRDDHVLVARLASEAEYFGMETMLDELQVLASIAPNFPGKGILYWLGTSMHKKEYQNPYKMNEIRVETIFLHSLQQSRPVHMNKVADFFQYRPSCEESNGPRALESSCCMLWCHLDNGVSRQFNFGDVMVKPSHYSLRYAACHGMSDWNFEASVDGVSWDVLHKARKDRHL